MSESVDPEYMDMRNLQEDPVVQPPVQLTREFALKIEYLDQSATLAMKVPNGVEVNKIVLLAARLAEGVPFDTMAPIDAARFRALATFAIVAQDPPTWVSRAVQEIDTTLLFAVDEEVSNYIRRYFRLDDGEGAGDSRKPRLVVEIAGA